MSDKAPRTSAAKSLHRLLSAMPATDNRSVADVLAGAVGFKHDTETFHLVLKYVRQMLDELLANIHEIDLDEDVRSDYRSTIVSLTRFFRPTNFDQPFGSHFQSLAGPLRVQSLLHLHGLIAPIHGYAPPNPATISDLQYALGSAETIIVNSTIDPNLRGFLQRHVKELHSATTLIELLGTDVLRDVWANVFGSCVYRFHVASDRAANTAEAKVSLRALLSCLVKTAIVLHAAAQFGQSIDWYASKIRVLQDFTDTSERTSDGSLPGNPGGISLEFGLPTSESPADVIIVDAFSEASDQNTDAADKQGELSSRDEK